MRPIITVMMALMLTVGALGADKISESFMDNGTKLLGDIKSPQAYKAFVSMYRNLNKGQIQEKLAVVGILGAQLHRMNDELTFFSKFLKQNYPNSREIAAIEKRNISDVCNNCRGQASAARPCTACRGSGACTNASCTDGKVTGYDRVDGRFVPVQRDCIICKGGGKCNTCSGSGETLGGCRICSRTGIVYSTAKALDVYKNLINEILESAEENNQKVKETEMLAKGMVKIDGVWYTPEQIAEMEREAMAARRRADEAERIRLEAEENRRRQEEAVALLQQSDEMLKNDPDQTINMLQNFINKYPSHEKIEVVKKELEYAGIYREALELEKEGAVTKALEKYNEAVEVKKSEDLLQKIEYLDNQTIGL